MPEVLKTLESTLDTSAMAASKAEHLQDCLCGLLQVILVKVGHMLDTQLAANITEVIVSLFTQAGKVTENGLIAYQGLVVGRGEQIDFSERIGSYIKYAL